MGFQRPGRCPAIRREGFQDIILVSSVMIFALLSIRTIFLDGLIITGEHPLHYVGSYFMSRYYLPSSRMLGWDPRVDMGILYSLSSGTGMHLLVCTVNALLGGASHVLAYKISFALSYLLLSPSIYLYIKQSGGNRLAAIFAALLAIVALGEEPYHSGLGIKEIYFVGTWPARLALVSAFASLALYFMVMGEERMLSRLLLAFASSGLSALTMMTSIEVGLVLLVVHSLTLIRCSMENLPRSIRLRGLLGAVSREAVLVLPIAMMLGISEFYLGSVVRYSGIYFYQDQGVWAPAEGLPTYLYGLSPLLLAFFLAALASSPARAKGLRGRLLSYSITLSMLLVLIAASAASNDEFMGTRLAYLFALGCIGLLADVDPPVFRPLSAVLLALWLGMGPEAYTITLPLLPRMELGSLSPILAALRPGILLGVSRFFALSVSSVGFSRVAGALYRGMTSAPRGEVKNVYGLVLALLASTSGILLFTAHVDNTDLLHPLYPKKFMLSTDYGLQDEMGGIFSWIRDNVKNGQRVLFYPPYLELRGHGGVIRSYVFILAALYPHVSLVGASPPERHILSTLVSDSEEILGISIRRALTEPEILGKGLARLGISYLVVRRGLISRVLGEFAYFREVYSGNTFVAFGVGTGGPGGFSVACAPGSLRLRIEGARELVLKTMYYDRLVAVDEGSKIERGVLRMPYAPLYRGAYRPGYALPVARLSAPHGGEIEVSLRDTIQSFPATFASIVIWATGSAASMALIAYRRARTQLSRMPLHVPAMRRR